MSETETIKTFIEKFNALTTKQKTWAIIIAVVLIGLIVQVSGANKPSKCDCKSAYEDYLFEGKSVSKWSDCVDAYKSDVNDYLNKSGRSLMPNNSGSFGGAWESGAYDYFKNNCSK